MIYAVRKLQTAEVKYISAATAYRAKECAGQGNTKGLEVIGCWTIADYENNVRQVQTLMKKEAEHRLMMEPI